MNCNKEYSRQKEGKKRGQGEQRVEKLEIKLQNGRYKLNPQ